MSALRKAGVWLGLVEDDDDSGYDGSGSWESSYRDRDRGERYTDEDERAARPARTERSRIPDRLSGRADQDRTMTRPAASSSYATRDNAALAAQPVHQRAAEKEQRCQIVTLHPTSYRDARTIGEHFRDGTPVIINLTGMTERDAYQMVDFAAGLAFGLRGAMDRVTNRVFLLSPAHVQVTAEDKERIAEGGFSAQG